MIKAVMDFLFGKDPDIFDRDGTVRHNLPQQKWDAWKSRYTSQPEYNWRNHTGMKAKDRRPTKAQ